MLKLKIVDRTAQAYQIENPNFGRYLQGQSGNVDSLRYIWIPISVCKIESDMDAYVVAIEDWFIKKNERLNINIGTKEETKKSLSRLEKHLALVAWAKEQGIKGIREFIKGETLRNKIWDAGLQIPEELK